MMVTISNAAKDRLLELLKKEGSSKKYVRVGVESGGCSGLSYKLVFENEKDNENGNEVGEDTYAEALRAPRVGSPAFVSIFVIVFVFICVFISIYSTSANLLNICKVAQHPP